MMLRLLCLALATLWCAPLVAEPTIEDLTSQLAELFGEKTFAIETESRYSQAMVREFLTARYDAPTVEDYAWTEWAGEIVADQLLAGTVTLKGAVRAVEGSLSYVYDDKQEVDLQRVALGGKLVRKLKKLPGVYFGFDGFAQSNCAAPTEYLIVLDTLGQNAYGFELIPCYL